MKFCWTEEAENAFVDTKSSLASRPILKTPDFDRPFCAAVDASDHAIGAVLFKSMMALSILHAIIVEN